MKNLPNENIIDAISWRILEELQTDGRITFAELGRRVGLSTPAAIERVRRLEDAGVIEGYFVRVNLKRLGLPMTAFVHIKALAGECQVVANALKSMPEILECHRVTGEECYIVRIAFASMEHLGQILDKLNPLGQTSSSLVVATPVQHKAVNQVTVAGAYLQY